MDYDVGIISFCIIIFLKVAQSRKLKKKKLCTEKQYVM